MSERPNEDEVLREFLTGQDEPTESALDRALGDASPERAKWDELRQTRDLLDDYGQSLQADLEDAAASPPLPRGRAEEVFAAMVRRGARDRVGSGDPPATRKWPFAGRVTLAVAAAAAVLMAFFGIRHYLDSATDRNIALGDDMTAVQPVGRVESFEVFEVRTFLGEVPSSWFVEIEVFDADRPGRLPVKSMPILDRTTLTKGIGWTWKPEPDLELPARINWRATLVSGNSSGDWVFVEASAER